MKHFIELRKDIPFLRKQIDGQPIIYLDNAATTHKPQPVIDALVDFYSLHNAPIHRSAYKYAEHATQLYENARKTVQIFIGARFSEEIIFTHGATHGINAVAATWGLNNINEGDEIVITQLEHHTNMIPWQQVAEKKRAILKYIHVLSDGMLDMSQLDVIITNKTKLVAITHSSNAIGIHVDVHVIGARARVVGAKLLIDAAQSVPYQRINVQMLQADFLVFSGHKMGGPTGIGVLFIKKELHQFMPPYEFGGGMVFSVDLHKASWADAPQKYEAGTPPIAQAIGLGVAIQYLEKNVNFDDFKKHQAQLCTQFIDGLSSLSRIRILGPLNQLKQSGHMVSFIVDGMHAHDVAAYCDMHNICVRAGHHCAQPLAQQLEYKASTRVSFYWYNTQQEVQKIITVLKQLISE